MSQEIVIILFAPIADNRMFQIIGLFVFITEKAVSQVN